MPRARVVNAWAAESAELTSQASQCPHVAHASPSPDFVSAPVLTRFPKSRAAFPNSVSELTESLFITERPGREKTNCRQLRAGGCPVFPETPRGIYHWRGTD